MKVFHILLVSLGLLLAGGWTDGSLAADDRGTAEPVESREGLTHSSTDNGTALPTGDLPGIQERLISDEAVFRKIQALRDDPDIQAVLGDDALMEALRAGNLNALISNPNFMKLLENPAIQKIMKEVR
jgi:hypothetical protein